MYIVWKDWHVIRIIRLLFGVGGITAFLMSHDPVFLLIAIVLLPQALFNSSCGIGGCGYPMNKKQTRSQPPEVSNIKWKK